MEPSKHQKSNLKGTLSYKKQKLRDSLLSRRQALFEHDLFPFYVRRPNFKLLA
jgi:hypothetical protein